MKRLAGISLIEVLVSLVIGALGLIGGMQLLQTAGVFSVNQQSYMESVIDVHEALLLLNADLEYAQPVQEGSQRVIQRRSDNGYELILARDALDPETLNPQLLSVRWVLGPEGMTRTVVPRSNNEDTRVLVEKPVMVRSENSQSESMHRWIITVNNREYWFWFSTQ